MNELEKLTNEIEQLEHASTEHLREIALRLGQELKEAKDEVERLKEENAILVKVRNVAMAVYANRHKVTDDDNFDIYLELMKIGRADIPYCELKSKERKENRITLNG